MSSKLNFLATAAALAVSTVAAAQTQTTTTETQPTTTTQTTTTQTQPTTTQTQPATTQTQPATTQTTPSTTTQTTTQTQPATTQTTTQTPATTQQADAAAQSGASRAATADDLKVGVSVFDKDGGLVGKIEKVDADGAIVSTGKARVSIPLASFGVGQVPALIVGTTRAELEAQAEPKAKTKSK